MYQAILDFWFNESDPAMWWQKSADFDVLIKNRFGALHSKATKGECVDWRTSAKGALAEVIVLDQFSRNMYRDTAQSFDNDPLALALAQFAIEKGLDADLSQTEKSFLYLPFMHSESAIIHQYAVRLYTNLGSDSNLQFELKHKAIIDQFGRYPHRNAVLGRTSTEAEKLFLTQPDSSF